MNEKELQQQLDRIHEQKDRDAAIAKATSLAKEIFEDSNLWLLVDVFETALKTVIPYNHVMIKINDLNSL